LRICGRSIVRLFVAPAVAAATLAAFVDVRPGQAEDWAESPFQYNVVDQDLRQVLGAYARQLGILVQVTENVRGRVRNLHVDGTAEEFLERLANDHDLVWHYDGSILHVATTSEVMRQALPTGSVAFDRLLNAVEQYGRADARLGVRPGPDPDLIYVTGPASYVEFVQQTAASLTEAASPVRVRIYRAGKLDETL
jgi:type II secretory pathway component GspD/PulD (secretin)